MAEPKWRITIDGEGAISQQQWEDIHSVVPISQAIRYEEFPLYVVEGEVRELVSEPSRNADRSGRGETPTHRTGRCDVHGYYCWLEIERASTDPTCPGCVREGVLR